MQAVLSAAAETARVGRGRGGVKARSTLRVIRGTREGGLWATNLPGWASTRSSRTGQGEAGWREKLAAPRRESEGGGRGGLGATNEPARVGVNARSAYLIRIEYPHPRHSMHGHSVHNQILGEDRRAHSAEVHALLLLLELRLR